MPPPRRNQNLETPATSIDGFQVSSGALIVPQRIGIFGSAGSGKTSLASLLSKIGKQPLFLDTDDGSNHMEVQRLECRNLSSWPRLRAAIHDEALWKNFDTVILDSLTKAEDMASQFVMDQAGVDALEKVDGGWGKGYRAVYESMLLLLADLDQHIRAGRNVVIVMHDCVTRTANPAGSDYLRFEPRLYASEKVSVRSRVKEWLDHLFFIGYDVASKDNKGVGFGSRTIYCREQAWFLAKSRTLRDPIVFNDGDPELWKQLFQGGG